MASHATPTGPFLEPALEDLVATRGGIRGLGDVSKTRNCRCGVNHDSLGIRASNARAGPSTGGVGTLDRARVRGAWAFGSAEHFREAPHARCAFNERLTRDALVSTSIVTVDSRCSEYEMGGVTRARIVKVPVTHARARIPKPRVHARARC